MKLHELLPFEWVCRNEEWESYNSAYVAKIHNYIINHADIKDWDDEDCKNQFLLAPNDYHPVAKISPYAKMPDEVRDWFKNNWSKLDSLLYDIALSGSTVRTDLYNKLEEELLKHKGEKKRFPAQIHRIVATLQPNCFTSMVADNYLNELVLLLQKNNIDFDYDKFWSADFYGRSHIVYDFLCKEYPTQDYNRSTLAWLVYETIQNINIYELYMMEIKNLIRSKKQVILQGAPGTGKTYATMQLSVDVVENKLPEEEKSRPLVDRYKDYCSRGQIEFVTFHLSMDYEDFVEGIKATTIDGKISYSVESGIFKRLCDKAKINPSNNYVLIIDEINRGNVSKIFGELITLIEADKRGDVYQVTLPYSKELFSVPENLYIIGTMNTTDRSVGSIDYALRRRFAFATIKADRKVLEDWYGENNVEESVKEEALNLFDDVQSYLQKNNSSDIDLEDLMVGHSYFMAKDDSELHLKRRYEIKPLLDEYYKDGLLKEPWQDAHQSASAADQTQSEDGGDVDDAPEEAETASEQ